MRVIYISVLFLVILLLAIVLGAHARSESSNPAADSADNPSVNSPFPLTSPKRDIAILAAPDGTIYLVEHATRKIVWSFPSGASIYSSYQALPSHDEDAFAEGDNFYIDCGEDWKLYVHGNGFKKELFLNVEDLLRQTPYVSAGGGVMLSSKKTTVFLVDGNTGKVLHSFKSDNFSLVENQDDSENPIVAIKDFEEYIAYESKSISKPLYVMRTDYSLKYTSSKTGKMMWYLTFADIEASFQCEGIEKLLDGNSYEKQFGPGDTGGMNLPLDCHISLPVYRTRDRSSLESLFMSDGLLKSLPRDELLSLPSAVQGSILKPLDKLFLLPQNNEDGKVPALPTTETELLPLPTADQASLLKPRDKLFLLPRNNEDGKGLALPSTEIEKNRILSFPGYNGSEMNVNVASDSNAGILILLFAFITAVLFFVVSFVRRLAVGKKSKLQKDFGDLIAQTPTTKKKKARKAGTRNSSNDKRKQKDASSDERISATNGRSNLEITQRSSQLAFSKVSEGDLDGRKIGKLVLSNKEIAKGSNGTVVLEGYYDGRPVAVKRLVQTHHDVAVKEIQNLIASDQHPNIVRWYGVEYDQDFVYLSLERCTCSLDELISSYSSSYQNQEASHGERTDSLSDCTLRLQYTGADGQDFKLWKGNGYPSPQLLKLMRDTVSGLAHLHELGIVHRDLKPQNVLVIKERSLCAKLSDMGISKRLAGNMSALTRNATGYGSSGWQAPEQLRGERQTRALDLFSLGCVFFFCITGGQHPFGEIWERDGNIFRDQKDLFLIESLPEAKDLISRLLDPKPELRPKTGEILSHPFFWNSEMRLSFLRDASDRVELEDRTNNSELLNALESVATASFGSKWDEKLETIFINDIGRYRRYKFDSLRDLLRVIRNKLNHYRELSKEIQEILGQVPEGFDNYFSTRFPNLLIEVYKVIQSFCAEEDNFRKYFVSNQF